MAHDPSVGQRLVVLQLAQKDSRRRAMGAPVTSNSEIHSPDAVGNPILSFRMRTDSGIRPFMDRLSMYLLYGPFIISSAGKENASETSL